VRGVPACRVAGRVWPTVTIGRCSVVLTGPAVAVSGLPEPVPVPVTLARAVSWAPSTAPSRLRYSASASFGPGRASTGTGQVVGTSTVPPRGMLARPGTAEESRVRVLSSGRVNVTATPVTGVAWPANGLPNWAREVNGWPTDAARGVTSTCTTFRIPLPLPAASALTWAADSASCTSYVQLAVRPAPMAVPSTWSPEPG